MAKYCGMAGFSIQKEVRPGVWQEVSHEHPVFGDVYVSSFKTENGGSVNDNLVLNSQISILFDDFITAHSYNIKYITYLGAKWTVKSIRQEYPRLILELGGVYND